MKKLVICLPGKGWYRTICVEYESKNKLFFNFKQQIKKYVQLKLEYEKILNSATSHSSYEEYTKAIEDWNQRQLGSPYEAPYYFKFLEIEFETNDFYKSDNDFSEIALPEIYELEEFFDRTKITSCP